MKDLKMIELCQLFLASGGGWSKLPRDVAQAPEVFLAAASTFLLRDTTIFAFRSPLYKYLKTPPDKGKVYQNKSSVLMV